MSVVIDRAAGLLQRAGSAVQERTGSKGRRKVHRINRPTFVLIDDDPLWHSFHQTAAVLRRSGCRTIRATVAPSRPIRRALDRLIYDERVDVTDAGDMSPLVARLTGYDVANIFAVESILAEAEVDAFDEVSGQVGDEWRKRKRYCDKAEVARLAAELGVRAPEQLPVAEHSVEEAIAVLGLPLVLKVKIGAAGAGVRIAANESEVRSALQELGDPSTLVYERFVTGPIVAFNAMVGDHGVVQETVRRGVASSDAPTQASLTSEVVDDEPMREIGRVLCAAVGLRGPIDIQAVLDAEGRHWVIDLNARPYGNMFSWDQREFDTGAAFLASMNLSKEPPRHVVAEVGTRVQQFPNDVENQARSGAYGNAIRTFLTRSPRFVGHLGPRYLAYVLLAAIADKLGI